MPAKTVKVKNKSCEKYILIFLLMSVTASI
jgi:hypothetical protein